MSKYLNVRLDEVIKMEGGSKPVRFFRNKNNHPNHSNHSNAFNNKSPIRHGNSGIFKKTISKPFTRDRQYNRGGDFDKKSPSLSEERVNIYQREIKFQNKTEKETINRFTNNRRIEKNEREYKETRVIKIKNLNTNVEIGELFELLEPCGKLLNISITWDHLEAKDDLKCYAVVEFKEDIGAMSAIEQFNGAELDGLVLEVNFYSKN